MGGLRRKVKSDLPAFFQSTEVKPFANDAAYEASKGSSLANGDAYYNTTDDSLRIRDEDTTNWLEVHKIIPRYESHTTHRMHCQHRATHRIRFDQTGSTGGCRCILPNPVLGIYRVYPVPT